MEHIEEPAASGGSYQLSHELHVTPDGKQQWRVWVDAEEALISQIERIAYTEPLQVPPEQSRISAADRFSILVGDGNALTIHAALTLADGSKLLLVHRIVPEPLPKPDKRALIGEARQALLGEARTGRQLAALCAALEAVDQFDYASELLLLKIAQDRQAGQQVPLSQFHRLAKYIYKDDSLASRFKFDRALGELNAADPLNASEHCETLGLAGAIYKRKWQHDHQHKHLVLARHYYHRGFGLWRRFIGGQEDLMALHDHNDQGYNAINYAYILELEAVNDMEETGQATGLRDLNVAGFREAQQVRKYIIELLVLDPFTSPRLKINNLPSWVWATVAEAYFGLCRYEEALLFIDAVKSRQQHKPWELRSFGQQIFSIAYLQRLRDGLVRDHKASGFFPGSAEEGAVDEAQINRCLNALDIRNTPNQEIRKDGKTGLALSGGGFRASLFHIGVLAALAERDELRHIEVISCVSGGSIIGAYYYLKLKLLLEEKADADITRQDYIDLVKETERDFLAGVQKNLRMHIFSDVVSNVRMLFKNYSRTNRLGELYEEHLYRPIFKQYVDRQKEKAGGAYKEGRYDAIADGQPIYMGDLFINPEDDFVFETDNWKRRNKVPQLILNATSINTGHNWQFTASWMGEPAAGIIPDIDVKSRLRRMYYGDAPEPYRQFRLGYAVGASSCVPVMFEPLPLNDLYPGIDLQLIDGGLHDNQGIAAIIDEECKNVYISDASGQLATDEDGVSGAFSLFMRADNILQERLRELQFLDMKERKSTALVNRLVNVHLKNGIAGPAVNWKNCTDPPRTISHVDPTVKAKDLMPYGILRDMQQLISGIRTDLDAFHDVEAYALMYNGYVQMHYEMARAAGADPDPVSKAGWRFFAVGEYLKDPTKAASVSRKLAVSAKVPLKLLHLMTKPIRIGLLVAALLAAGGLLYMNWGRIPERINIPVWAVVTTVVIFVLGMVFKPASALLNPKGYIQKQLLMIGMAVVGWLVFKAYLVGLNPLYLRIGRLKQQTGEEQAGGEAVARSMPEGAGGTGAPKGRVSPEAGSQHPEVNADLKEG